jgi:hypothetical protein
MIGNIRTASHQEVLLPTNIWDLIWDESYHPAVLSAEGLFEKSFVSLRHGGVFVFTLPIKKEGDFWITGHKCDDKITASKFNEKLAYAPLSPRFNSLEEIEAFIRDNLTSIGFSSVKLHRSILTTALENVTGQTSFETVNESLLELLDSEIMRIVKGGGIHYLALILSLHTPAACIMWSQKSKIFYKRIL